MDVRVTTRAAEEPLTLEEAKEHLKLETDVETPLVSSLIKAATQQVQQYLGKTLTTTIYDYHFYAPEGEAIGVDTTFNLPRGPCQHVTQVSYVRTVPEYQPPPIPSDQPKTGEFAWWLMGSCCEGLLISPTTTYISAWGQDGRLPKAYTYDGTSYIAKFCWKEVKEKMVELGVEVEDLTTFLKGKGLTHNSTDNAVLKAVSEFVYPYVTAVAQSLSLSQWDATFADFCQANADAQGWSITSPFYDNLVTNLPNITDWDHGAASINHDSSNLQLMMWRGIKPQVNYIKKVLDPAFSGVPAVDALDYKAFFDTGIPEMLSMWYDTYSLDFYNLTVAAGHTAEALIEYARENGWLEKSNGTLFFEWIKYHFNEWKTLNNDVPTDWTAFKAWINTQHQWTEANVEATYLSMGYYYHTDPTQAYVASQFLSFLPLLDWIRCHATDASSWAPTIPPVVPAHEEAVVMDPSYYLVTGSDRLTVTPLKDWPASDDGYTITFSAGMGTAAEVPEDIKLAMKLMIGHWFEERTGREMPKEAMNMLKYHRRLRL